jgi:hypothetical protein
LRVWIPDRRFAASGMTQVRHFATDSLIVPVVERPC